MKPILAKALDSRSKDLDVLCFPDIYPYGICGQHEERPVKLRSADYIKQRLLSKHPHFRQSIQYLFYLMHDSNMRNIRAGIYHFLNIVDANYKYNVKNILERLENKLEEANLNTIFSIRGTEAYWVKPRRELEFMVNEYGPVTWFITLSHGEWMCPELGEYIKEIEGWEDDGRSVSQLVADAPVAASMYFNNKFQAQFAYILSDAKPIGQVEHWYYAVEYQGRGVPHYHMTFWIHDAPIYGISSDEEVKNFIMQYATCSIPNKNVSPELYRKVMAYQVHKDNPYCLRQKKTKKGVISVCRFGYPMPPTDVFIFRDIINAIANRHMLNKNSKLYSLPRKNTEIWINDYIPAIFCTWEGNMDVQFIGEKTFLLTNYVTKYSSKGEKSNIDASTITNNTELVSKVWSLALKGLSHRECGAIQAADALIGYPLHATDKNTVFRYVDVNMNRRRKLVDYNTLKNMPEDSEKIFCESLVDTYYPQRPKELESLSLYDFAKWWDVWKNEPVRKVEYYQMENGRFCKKRKNPYLITHYRPNPKNYYFVILLLFKPWRNIQELKGNQDNFTEAFLQIKTELAEAMKYHDKNELISCAMENASKLVEQRILQNAESEQGEKNSVPNSVPMHDGLVANAVADMIQNVVQSLPSIEESIEKFNVDQLRIFNDITTTLLSKERIIRKFVSGPGGTGKSFLIETLILWNNVKRQKNTVVTAPTGIAAYNVRGFTVHKLLQIPVVTDKKEISYKALSDEAIKRIRSESINVDLFIIDEISMISNILLLFIHLRLNEIFATTDEEDGYFGKINIIVFGDLLQLPPVDEPFEPMKADLFKKVSKAMAPFNLWSLFEFDELSINIRQKNDALYADILSRVRLGYATNTDVLELQKRKINFTSEDRIDVLNKLCETLNTMPNDAVCLLPNRDMCKTLNETMLQNIKSEKITLIAIDSYKCSGRLQNRISKLIDKHDEKICGVPRVLEIKIGCRVMIRRNIDISLGLVNVTIGTVICIAKSKDKVDSIKIRIETGQEYDIERFQFQFILIDKIWVTREQFPFSLSYGITIHKSKGLSLRHAVVDAGNNIFACGQTYVALSRVTTLEGLHLINFDPSRIKVNLKAVAEYSRLRKKYCSNIFDDSLDTLRALQDVCLRKFHDIQWADLEERQQVQNCFKYLEDNWSVRGLPNVDNASSYSNSCLLAIFNSLKIRKYVASEKAMDPLKNIFNEYVTGSRIDINPLKLYLKNIEYLSLSEHDAAEFLLDICKKCKTVKQITEHQLNIFMRCPASGCDLRLDAITVENYILTLSVTDIDNTYTLQDILDRNYSIWQDVDDLCDRCEYKLNKKVNIIIRKEKFLIMKLLIFIDDDDESEKLKILIKEVPKSTVSIKNSITSNVTVNNFNVVSAILHHGRKKNGTYSVVLRQDIKSNKWKHITDLNEKYKAWPRNAKDVYILILEQI